METLRPKMALSRSAARRNGRNGAFASAAGGDERLAMINQCLGGVFKAVLCRVPKIISIAMDLYLSEHASRELTSLLTRTRSARTGGTTQCGVRRRTMVRDAVLLGPKDYSKGKAAPSLGLRF